MQARKLKKLLNNTGYIVHGDEKRIMIGSPYISDLIGLDMESLKIKYALDTFNEGITALKNKELFDIWNKLHGLIESNEIKDIFTGVDVIPNPLKVYTVKNGLLIEKFTDEYGYPNVTHDGELMYNNVYFKSQKEAVKYYISEYEAGIRNTNGMLHQKENEIKQYHGWIEEFNKWIDDLKKITFE